MQARAESNEISNMAAMHDKRIDGFMTILKFINHASPCPHRSSDGLFA